VLVVEVSLAGVSVLTSRGRFSAQATGPARDLTSLPPAQFRRGKAGADKRSISTTKPCATRRWAGVSWPLGSAAEAQTFTRVMGPSRSMAASQRVALEVGDPYPAGPKLRFFPRTLRRGRPMHRAGSKTPRLDRAAAISLVIKIAIRRRQLMLQ
jgi:hypothetical protein